MTHKRGAHFLLRHRFLRLGAQVARRRFLPQTRESRKHLHRRAGAFLGVVEKTWR
jgi:hypothetical protein